MIKLLMLALLALPVWAQYDKYGGRMELQCPSGPKPLFYTEKIGDRWWFCTPAGNVFWYHGVWNSGATSSTDRSGQKFGGSLSSSESRTAVLARRYTKWGFNGFDGYSSRFVLPTANAHLQPKYGHALAAIMGEGIRPSYYGLFNDNRSISQPLKNFDTPLYWHPGNAARTGAWRLQDIFDANYKIYFTSILSDPVDTGHSNVFSGSLATPENRSYVLGWMVDDTDWVAGFGAGPNFPTFDNGNLISGRRHPHLSYATLTTAPTQGAFSRDPAWRFSADSISGLLYADPRTGTVTCNGPEQAGTKGLPGYAIGAMTQTVYPSDTICTKRALIKMLQNKYGSIAALNAAWGSSYTTWDSSGTNVTQQLIATTNGNRFQSITIPGITSTNQISPYSFRLYVNNVYVGADARHRDVNVFACHNGALRARNRGQIWGAPLAGSVLQSCANDPTSFTVTNGVGSITTSSTGTFASPANLSVGDLIVITGCNTAPTSICANGPWPVASVGPGQAFTLTMAGIPNGSYNEEGLYLGENLVSEIRYDNGAVYLRFDTAPPAGQEIRATYTINGWERGTGLLDEDGQGKTHLPNWEVSGSMNMLLEGMDPDIKSDLDEFLYRYAYRYFKDMRDALDAKYQPLTGCDRTIDGGKGICPLYTGTSYLGTWGSPTFAQVVRAASEMIDIYPYYSWPDQGADYLQRLEFIYTHWGDKPIISWEGHSGGKDSPFPVDGGDQIRSRVNTQEARGQHYKTAVSAMQNYRYPNGSYPAIGTRWWDLRGSTSEVMNWGFLTPNDDPIDGYCPGPGTRMESIPGGPVLTSVVVASSVGTVTTTRFHSMSVGSMIRFKGCTVDSDLCKKDWPVTAVAAGNFTIALDSSVGNATYNEAGLSIAHAVYPCGGSNQFCILCTSGSGANSNRYLTTCNNGTTFGRACDATFTILDDPRRATDPDGPWNERFGNFLSSATEANGYWLNLLPNRKRTALE